MAVAAVISFVGAILVLAIPVARADVPYKQVLGIIIAVFMFVLSALIAIYLWLNRDTEPNFFLFDRQRKRNISLDDLTFKFANERLSFLLTTVSQSPEELWREDVLENELKLGYRKVYRPLIAYKMLYDLIELDRQETWELFTGAEADVISTLCRVLSSCGEVDMSNTLMDAYEGAESVDDIEYARDFIMGNAKYIRRRMRDYVLKNIEEFY